MQRETSGRAFHVAVALMAMLFVSALIVRTSVAAFSDTTDNVKHVHRGRCDHHRR
jgi:hypothetical protein